MSGVSLLSKVSTGKNIGAQIHVITGDNGVGKTTFACAFPNAIIADLENGSRHIENATRLAPGDLPNLDAVRSLLVELAQKSHNYKTLIIDSVESLEGLISDAVCAEGKVKSIELYDGGFGKGYTRSRELMREVMGDLRALQTKGITCILIAHTQTKSKTDPATNQTYDRVIMRCNDKMAAIIRDLADNVFYATHKVHVETENKKTKAYGDGQRVMFTQWRPGFDAKNRLDLPHELPLSYDAFISACEGPKDLSSVLQDIYEMAEKCDEQLKKSIREQVEKHQNNPAKLNEIRNRLMKLAAA